MASRAGWPCSSRSGPCPPGVRCRVYACVRVQTQRPRARDRLHVEQGAHTRVPLCVSWLLRVLGLCRESAQVEPTATRICRRWAGRSAQGPSRLKRGGGAGPGLKARGTLQVRVLVRGGRELVGRRQGGETSQLRSR